MNRHKLPIRKQVTLSIILITVLIILLASNCFSETNINDYENINCPDQRKSEQELKEIILYIRTLFPYDKYEDVEYYDEQLNIYFIRKPSEDITKPCEEVFYIPDNENTYGDKMNFAKDIADYLTKYTQ